MKRLLYLLLSLAIVSPAFADVPSTARSRQAVSAQSDDLARDMADAGFALGDRLYIQLTKYPAELTVYVETDGGTYAPFRTWPICTYSGGLGPKRKQGDGKSPEGFYAVRPGAMNPASSYHLSFNLGYPNRYDRAQGYTGDYLMVHGRCVSIGCYAMTDDVIEQIWTLMDAAYQAGQSSVPVHIFPFRMTPEAMQIASGHPESAFWNQLAPAWQAFEESGKVPGVTVRGGKYVLSDPSP